MKRKLIVVVMLLCVGLLHAQNSVSFYKNSLEQVISIAKAEGKDIFLDAYAPWCKPCKKMDKVFANRKVAAFYNQNFVNIKINVDQVAGKEIATKYGIAFLPTMLILDENGYVKQRIDGLMTADQMLEIGDVVVNNVKPVAITAKPKKAVVASRPATPANSGEKILKVLDDKDLFSNPDYLYHEAFYQVGRMSGEHDSLAIKYLETQEDWSTVKNMNFIVSFLDNTNSQMFDYYVEKKDTFQSLIGPKQYRQTLEIVINDCLYRQFPRPSPEKVEYLYSLLYPRKAEKFTYQYLLNRYELEQNYGAYVDVGEEYLATLLQPDATLLYKLGKYKCLNANRKELKECIFRVEESIRLSDDHDYDQFLTLAKLYHKVGKEKKAIDAAEKAKELSLGSTEAQSYVNAFIESLEKL